MGGTPGLWGLWHSVKELFDPCMTTVIWLTLPAIIRLVPSACWNLAGLPSVTSSVHGLHGSSFENT